MTLLSLPALALALAEAPRPHVIEPPTTTHHTHHHTEPGLTTWASAQAAPPAPFRLCRPEQRIKSKSAPPIYSQSRQPDAERTTRPKQETERSKSGEADQARDHARSVMPRRGPGSASGAPRSEAAAGFRPSPNHSSITPPTNAWGDLAGGFVSGTFRANPLRFGTARIKSPPLYRSAPMGQKPLVMFLLVEHDQLTVFGFDGDPSNEPKLSATENPFYFPVLTGIRPNISSIGAESPQTGINGQCIYIN